MIFFYYIKGSDALSGCADVFHVKILSYIKDYLVDLFVRVGGQRKIATQYSMVAILKTIYCGCSCII